MTCGNKIKNNCGKKVYAECVYYEGTKPEWSELDDCSVVEETTEELYTKVTELLSLIDVSNFESNCEDLTILEEGGEVTLKSLLQTLLNVAEGIKCGEITIKEDVDISKWNLDLLCLSEPCDTPITKLSVLIQTMITKICDCCESSSGTIGVFFDTIETDKPEETPENPDSEEVPTPIAGDVIMIKYNDYVVIYKYSGTSWTISLLIPIGGGSFVGYTTVQNEGVNLTQRAVLNFIGRGVNAFDSGGKTNVDVTLKGENYLYVYANGTHIENYAELLAAYTLAKTLTPNFLPISATNRVTIIMGAGYYTANTLLNVDTDYIDFVSLSGNCDVILNGTSTIQISANNVYIKGVNTLTRNFTIPSLSNTDYIIENCKGGDSSFGGDTVAAGTFINCTGTGSKCFGGGFTGVASGTFIDCKGIGASCFGGNGVASGTFTNCTSNGQYSFGGSGNECSGTFTNCIGVALLTFGGGSLICSGKFYNCRGGNESFGGGANVDLNGTVCKNCVGLEGSFGSGDSSTSVGAEFYDCIGTDYSFGGGNLSNSSGKYINCVGGELSFGGAGTAEGIFINCIGRDGSFGGYTVSFATNTASGTFTNCVGKTGCFGGNNGGTGLASGKFTNCVAEVNSFGAGAGATLTGQLYFCRLEGAGATFKTPTGSGKITLGIDGTNAIITT